VAVGVDVDAVLTVTAVKVMQSASLHVAVVHPIVPAAVVPLVIVSEPYVTISSKY